MFKILVLGASGMLGNTVMNCLAASDGIDAIGTVRNPSILEFFQPAIRERLRTNINVLEDDNLVSLLSSINPDVVINCIGLIKQLESVNDPLVALPINTLFPHRLARLCSLCDARLIHVSTDCVFTGQKGNYVEADVCDATDIYGRSKFLGEVTQYPHAITLRTSIIGRELSSANSLLNWFLSQSGSVNGFTRAIFSGLPAWELASVIRDVVIPQSELTGLYHVSSEAISKFDLLTLVAKQYGIDIKIEPHDQLVIDRSLDSSRFTKNSGYKADDWPELIRRMHESEKNLE